MITIYQETTKWDVPNGIYHLNEHDYLVGYQAPNGEYKEFKNPLKRFVKRGRTFKKIGTREET